MQCSRRRTEMGFGRHAAKASVVPKLTCSGNQRDQGLVTRDEHLALCVMPIQQRCQMIRVGRVEVKRHNTIDIPTKPINGARPPLVLTSNP